MLQQFIQDVREEKNGFRLDKPWRLEEKSLGVIVPVIREFKAKRTYIVLAEAENIKNKIIEMYLNFIFIRFNKSIFNSLYTNASI